MLLLMVHTIFSSQPPASQPDHVAEALAAPKSASAARRRQPPRLKAQQLSAEALVRELSRAARKGQQTYMLRLLLHHADQLNSVHLFLALEALAQVAPSSSAAAASLAAAAAAGPPGGPAAAAADAGRGAPAQRAQFAQRPRRQPVLIDTYRAMREVALELVAGEHVRGEAALGAACSLLHTSAAMRQPLAPAEQAVLESLAVAGLAEAHWRDLEAIVLAYAELGLQAEAELREAAASAAERLLPAANSRQLRAVLPAWQRCGWPVTNALASAAELAALTCLHNAVGTIMIHSQDASTSSSSSGAGGGDSSSSSSGWGGGDGSRESGSAARHGRPGDPWDSVTPHGQRSLTSLARVAARICEAFALAEWPLGPSLADDLRVALPFCVPAVSPALSGRLLASCLRLGLLPDPSLAAAFMQGAARQLPAAAPADAAGLIARLLPALALQVGRGPEPGQRRACHVLLGSTKLPSRSCLVRP